MTKISPVDFLVKKSVWWSSFSRDGIFLRIWAKIAYSNYWKMDQITFWHVIWTKCAILKRTKPFSSKLMIACQNPILVKFSIVKICDFGSDSKWDSGSKSHFHHMRMNFFKYFSGPKSRPPRISRTPVLSSKWKSIWIWGMISLESRTKMITF